MKLFIYFVIIIDYIYKMEPTVVDDSCINFMSSESRTLISLSRMKNMEKTKQQEKTIINSQKRKKQSVSAI